MIKKIPLNDFHVSMGGRMVEFGGFNMPVRYGSIIDEHHFVRNKCGLFDVSHMGEFIVRGKSALNFLNKVMTRNITPHSSGKVLYSLMCNKSGGTVDDVLVYKFADDDYLIIVNASNIDKDREWFENNINSDVEFQDISSKYSLLALQGSLSSDILKKLGYNFDKMKYYTFEKTKYKELDLIVSRTGYTGEDGFELLIENSGVLDLIQDVMAAGNDNISLCGLGCRDLCRIEAGYPLYGHELSDSLNPLASPSNKVINLKKDTFIGKDALREPDYKIIGFEMAEKSIARENYEINDGNNKIGHVTSGIHSPLFNKGIGMGYIDKNYEKENIYINIRNKNYLAKIVKLPFYSNVHK